MLSGVILVNSTKKGSLTSWHSLGRETLIERQVRIMRKCCSEIILVTDQPKPYLERFGRTVRIINRFFDAKGVLSGIHAGFSLALNPLVWLVNGDMPYISDEVASLLVRAYRAEEHDAVLPHIDGTPIPLHGLYAAKSRTVAETLLDGGIHELDEFLRFLRVEYVRETALIKRDLDLGFAGTISV